MEDNNVIRKIDHNKNCFWGWFGAILGGVIGAAIWLICYILNFKDISILVALVPILATLGYKLLMETFNNKTFKCVMIVSIIIYFLSFALLIYELSNPFGTSLASKYYLKNMDKYEELEAKAEANQDSSINFAGDFFSFVLGSVISGAMIYYTLQKYKSTNNMIKDTEFSIPSIDGGNPIFKSTTHTERHTNFINKEEKSNSQDQDKKENDGFVKLYDDTTTSNNNNYETGNGNEKINIGYSMGGSNQTQNSNQIEIDGSILKLIKILIIFVFVIPIILEVLIVIISAILQV